MPDTTAFTQSSNAQKPEHFDVAIVGAGISGVGGAYHLTKQCPGTSFVVLEVSISFSTGASVLEALLDAGVPLTRPVAGISVGILINQVRLTGLAVLNPTGLLLGR